MLLLLLTAAYLAIFCVACVSPQSSNGWSAYTAAPPDELLNLWIDSRQVKMFSGKETARSKIEFFSLIVLSHAHGRNLIAADDLNSQTRSLNPFAARITSRSNYNIPSSITSCREIRYPIFLGRGDAFSPCVLKFLFLSSLAISMDIYAIRDEIISPYILDPRFEEYLPIIPSEFAYVNFTWQSGVRKYVYHFDKLESHNEQILEVPQISIPIKGRIPKRPKVFSVKLPCSGHGWGIARFSIGLKIEPRKSKPSEGMSLRVTLRKECAQRVVGAGPDQECDKKCANDGWCNDDKICQCKEGYVGQHCQTALCYPQCMNGGNCTAPGICSCTYGFQGRHCEGGICFEKCLNGGKCIQKDTCECTKGYYGLRCEFSRCIIPCLNGGRCKGVNKCRCPQGYGGDHCEIIYGTRFTSKRNSKRNHGSRNARGHNRN